MRITTKGQVTIPQDIRERHGFLPGTDVRFVDDGEEVRLVKEEEKARRGRSLVDHMRGRATTRLTTDEIMALTREDNVPSSEGPGEGRGTAHPGMPSRRTHSIPKDR
jgi:AbrB family looped-hinge helix DNA binding protein